MNLPNKLTVMRILLVFVILIISFLNISGEVFGISLKFLIIEIIFIIASITDHYDGYLARKNNQITTFGKFLDPIADKILVVTTMLLLTERGTLPAWIPIVTIFREFLVAGYRLVEAKGAPIILRLYVITYLKILELNIFKYYKITPFCAA